jgi:hypothetical protein
METEVGRAGYDLTPTRKRSRVPAAPELAELISTRAYTFTTLLRPDELSDEDRATVPAWVLESVAHDGPEGIVAATAHWEQVLPGLLDDTVAFFRERALGTYLGRVSSDWGGDLVLIYALRGENDPFVCWYGYPPTNTLDNPTPHDHRPGVKADLSQVSENLRRFYTQIHNRFRVVGLGECGLRPLDEFFTLDWDASDYDYRGDPGHRPDPSRLLPIFISAHGQLCVELGTENVWEQNDSELEPLGELWPNLNKRIVYYTQWTAGEIDDD